MKKLFPNLASILVASFALTQLILPILRTDLDFYLNFVSNYGVGYSWWIFTLGLTMLGAGKLLLTKNLLSNYPKNKLSKVIAGFIIISAIATIGVGLFQTDIGGEMTTIGLIHGIMAYVSFSATGVFYALILIYKRQIQKPFSLLEHASTFIYIALLVSFPFWQTLLTQVIVERLLVVMLAINNYRYTIDFK